MKLPKIIVVVGPTASGKSSLAIQLAKKYNGEIVSADSRQIYRGMDVGTAKPPRDFSNDPRMTSNAARINPIRDKFEPIRDGFESNGIRHHLIDIKNPDEGYTVQQFKTNCLRAINSIRKKGKLPIIAGGTGLYIKTVIDNLDIPRVKANPALRTKLENELKNRGLSALYKKLVDLDPEAAYIVDSKNPRRVIRALEITLLTNAPFSEQRKKGESLFDALQIGINLPREVLRKRIDERVDAMTNDGLFDEIKNLLKKYPATTPAFDAIGYREIIDCLHGKISREEAIDLIKKKTWQFARRQLTWFKADKTIKWIADEKEALELARQFLRSH